ncbi:hypothetical protein LCGC14_1777110 [marine sediment metagenome]|uniref:Uncharacterized protein n=1 Tax=marine sediment metagenome TaxID=412755 RepID=A0A0F9HJ26_9ZZZZ
MNTFIIADSIRDMVYVQGVECTKGHNLSALEFSGGEQKEWPVKCTSHLAESELIHPGCGASLQLIQVGDTQFNA